MGEGSIGVVGKGFTSSFGVVGKGFARSVRVSQLYIKLPSLFFT